MNISPEKLQEIIESHGRWLLDQSTGERADLSAANLSYANLRSANLSSANLRYANLSYANLSAANLRYADLSYANLSYANLSAANLRYADLSAANLSAANLSYANLRYADLDFSQLPLWCGSFDVKTDKRIAVQVLYHFCRLDCEDVDIVAAQKQVQELANQFHRVDECGKLDK